jgi:hypothetical protein
MEETRTCIGVLTTHDDPWVNTNLVKLFDEFCVGKNVEVIEKYHFIFTGGTFDRIIRGVDKNKGEDSIQPVDDSSTRKILLSKCGVTRLPSEKVE